MGCCQFFFDESLVLYLVLFPAHWFLREVERRGQNIMVRVFVETEKLSGDVRIIDYYIDTMHIKILTKY